MWCIRYDTAIYLRAELYSKIMILFLTKKAYGLFLDQTSSCEISDLEFESDLRLISRYKDRITGVQDKGRCSEQAIVYIYI